MMNIYNNLINNLETLELFRFKENIDTYLDMIADGKKQPWMLYVSLQTVKLILENSRQ